MTSRTVIAHGHIFKNAGTTLDWALRRNFRRKFLDHRDDAAFRKGGAAYLGDLLKAQANLCAISSHHMCYPLPSLQGVEIVPVYILRHPIERVLSVYEFERRQRADTPGAVNAKRMNAAEYVHWRLQPESGATVRDYQVRYLAGLHGVSKRSVAEADYEAAVENMTSACIGLVEQFDRSLAHIERILRRAFPTLDLSYVPQNVNSTRPETQEERIATLRARIGDELFAQLEEANRFDMALYDAAHRLLAERWRSAVGFGGDVEDFLERCERHR